MKVSEYTMNEQPIFILGAHKSGSTLLRGILDGHPDLFVIPFESHYFQNMGFWVDNNYRREHPEKLNRNEIVTSFTQYLERLNETEDRVGDTPKEFEINVQLFREVFQSISMDMDHRQRFNLFINALHKALYKKKLAPYKRVVEKSVEHAEFARFLYHMYPKAQFVHIIRNPYANAVSLRKAKLVQHKFPLIFRLLETLYNNYYHLYRNQHLIKSYYVIRYEDLLANPREEIKKLTDFLDIKFDPILLTPTKFGDLWGGNSSTGRELSGFDQSRAEAWKTEISPMEIRFINRLFPFIFEDFGYDQLPTPSLLSFLKPASGEGILRYLLNRGYLGYISYNPGSEI